MTDRLIRITTALAVCTVAAVAAVISYRHAFELVSMHGETGVTAHGLGHGPVGALVTGLVKRN